MADKKDEKAYHVSDLSEGQEPDPLADSSLTAQERATANVEHADGSGKGSGKSSGQ
jgi:hypothetical protein